MYNTKELQQIHRKEKNGDKYARILKENMKKKIGNNSDLIRKF